MLEAIQFLITIIALRDRIKTANFEIAFGLLLAFQFLLA